MLVERSSSAQQQIGRLIAAIPAAAFEPGHRHIVAIAGAPASGKSTFAEKLFDALEARRPGATAIMPMDGYHMDNAILSARGCSPRKGAPHTFDVDALERDLRRVRTADRAVLVPLFDRTLDLARASAREIGSEVSLVIVEGNYLLLDQSPWSRIRPLFDTTVFLSADEPILERRLVERWLHYGHDKVQARERAMANDLPNARLVARNSVPADIVIETG